MGYLERIIESAARPDIPADELRDMNGAVVRAALQGIASSDYAPQGEVLEFIRQCQKGDEEAAARQANRPFAKATILEPATYASAYPSEYRERRGHKSILQINEVGLGGAIEQWAEKPGAGTGFSFLRNMAAELDVVQAIIRTRCRQVSAFAQPWSDDDDNPLGYRWVRNDGERLSKSDERETKWLDRVLENCGTEFDPIARQWDLRRRSFGAFTEALIADTLTADACPVEKELAYNGKLAGWYNVPFDSVRLAFEQGYDGDDRIVAVQLAHDQQIAVLGYEKEDIIFDVRNARSDARYFGYGQAELESLVRAGTAYLNAFTYNAASVDRNSIPRGFMTLFGNYGPNEVRAFKTQWQSLLRGAAKRWALPVLVSKNKEGGATWTPVDTQAADMFNVKWLVFVISLACGSYQIAPEQIHMESFSSQTSSLSGKDTSEKLQSSHDTGLIPLMLWYFRWLNSNIVSQLTRKYRPIPVGLFPEDEQRKFERQKLGSTVNELRAIDGAPEHPDADIGNAPVNPSLLQIYNAKLGQKLGLPLGGNGQQQDDDEGGQGDERDANDAGDGLPSSERPLPYERGDEQNAGGADSGKQKPFAKAGAATPRLVVEIREVSPEAW